MSIVHGITCHLKIDTVGVAVVKGASSWCRAFLVSQNPGVWWHTCLFYMYECLPACVYVRHMCLMTKRARRRYWTPWSWSYGCTGLPNECWQPDPSSV